MRGVWVGLLLLALAACGGPSPVPTARRAAEVNPRFGDTDPHDWIGAAPWHYPVHGIDVSKYQGDIDWYQARAGGVSFAFIKATEGGDVADERFLDNWNGALRAGMPRGAYHYYYFCRSAAEQARWFIDHVPRDAAALPPVLDMEWTPRSRTCMYRPDPARVRDEMDIYLRTVAAHYRQRPVIYTTVDFYHENELWRVRGSHFWLRSVADHPSTTYPSQRWVFWQYTGTGQVPGVAGATDINLFGGSQAQWRQWVASGGG